MMKEVVQRFWFFFIFIVLVMLVTASYEWILELIQFESPYDKPMGDAVKVFEPVNQTTIPDRLMMFFLYGE